MSTSNLGGLCGLSCKTDQSTYNTATGACAYTGTSKPKCDRGAAHEMYFQGLGTTQSGSQVDLRVTNLTEYSPWDSNQNGLSSVWGQISMLANHPSEFLFEFFDTVHARPLLYIPPQCPLSQCLLNFPLQCALRAPPPCLPINRPPLSQLACSAGHRGASCA